MSRTQLFHQLVGQPGWDGHGRRPDELEGGDLPGGHQHSDMESGRMGHEDTGLACVIFGCYRCSYSVPHVWLAGFRSETIRSLSLIYCNLLLKKAHIHQIDIARYRVFGPTRG